MPDWYETLQDIGGALSGIPKGIDLGLAPFKTWEGVRTADLANDRTDIQLRDLLAAQNAREGIDEFGYYTDQAGAQQSGFQKARVGNERDIYGIGQEMDRRRYMEDPEGAFQQMVQLQGLRPEDPEYRRLAAEAMSYYDPMGAIAGYDKMGVPALEQRNQVQQAVMAMLQAKAPPGTTIEMMNDGTFLATGPDGEKIPIGWQQALLAASATGKPNDPQAALFDAIRNQIAVQTGNTNAFKAVYPADNMRGANAENSSLTQARLSAQSIASQAAAEIKRLEAAEVMEPGKHTERIEQLRNTQRLANERIQEIGTYQMQRGMGGGFGGGPASTRFGGRGGVAPQGGTAVTTRPTPPPGAGASRAAGGAGMGPPSPAPGAVAPTRPMTPAAPYLFEPQSGGYQDRQAAGGRNFWEPQQAQQEIPPEIAQLLMLLQQQGGA